MKPSIETHRLKQVARDLQRLTDLRSYRERMEDSVRSQFKLVFESPSVGILAVNQETVPEGKGLVLALLRNFEADIMCRIHDAGIDVPPGRTQEERRQEAPF